MVVTKMMLETYKRNVISDIFSSFIDVDIEHTGIGLICISVFLIFLLIAILISIWIYKDAEKRGKEGILWVIILILTGGIPGLVLWLLVRPDMEEVKKKELDRKEWGKQTRLKSTPRPPPPPPEEKNICPDCKRKLNYIKKYDRWYCYECEEYK